MADPLDPYGIGAARKQGYGDSEIVDYVGSAMGVNPDEIKTAREQGFRDKDILNYLLPPPPKPAPIEPPKTEKLTAPEESRGDWGSSFATGYHSTSQAIAATVVVRAAQDIENLRQQLETFQQGDPNIPNLPAHLMPQRLRQVPALEKKLEEAKTRYQGALSELGTSSEELKGLAVNEPLQRFMGGELGEIMKNPGAVMRGLIGGSATAMVPIIVGTALGGMAGSTIIGGAIGGGAIGAATGGGQQAVEILQKHKVDPRDINAVKAALADPEIKAEIDKAFGVAQAIDTATGVATGGLGGKTFGAQTVIGATVKNLAIQGGGQAALSAGGEAAKQAILDDKMNWGKVAAAGAAEALFAPVDVAVSAAFHGRGGKADTDASPRTPAAKTTEDISREVMSQDSIDSAIDSARRLISETEIDELRARARDTEDPMEIAQADILGIFKDKGVLNGGDVFQRPDGGYVYQMPDGKTEFDLKPWDGVERPDTIPAKLAEVQKEVYGKQGIDVVYIENDANIPFDGVVNNRLFPNTIFLANSTQRNAAQVTRHEWGHILETTEVPGTAQNGRPGVTLGEILYHVVERNMTPTGMAHVEALSGAEAPKRASYPKGAEGDALHQAAVKRFMVKEMIAEVGSETPHFPTYAVKVVDYVEARYGIDAAKQVVKDLITSIREAMGRLQEFFGKPQEYGPAPTQSQNWMKNLSEVHDVFAQIEAHRWGTKAEKENAALMAMREGARRDQVSFADRAPEMPPPWMPEGFLDPLPPSRISPVPGQPYNEARVRMEAYQTWYDQLDQKRRQEAAASPEAKALQDQIAGLIAKPRGRGEAGLTKRAAAQVEDLRQQLDAMLNPTQPSLDMVRVQEAMLREQQRMADAAAVGTPSPGMERAAAAAGQPAAPVTGEAAPAPVRGRAIMPEPVPAATRPITGEPVAAPPVAPVEVAPSTPVQAAAPAPAPTVPIVEAPTAPTPRPVPVEAPVATQLQREQAAVQDTVGSEDYRRTYAESRAQGLSHEASMLAARRADTSRTDTPPETQIGPLVEIKEADGTQTTVAYYYDSQGNKALRRIIVPERPGEPARQEFLVKRPNGETAWVEVPRDADAGWGTRPTGAVLPRGRGRAEAMAQPYIDADLARSVEPAAAAEPVVAEPTVSDYEAKVREAREQIWSGEGMGRYSRSGKPIRQKGGGHLAPQSVANERMVLESARDQVMRDEAAAEIEEATGRGLPEDAVFEVAQAYRRADGETPRQAFDRASDEWMLREEAKATAHYGDSDLANFDLLKSENSQFAGMFDALTDHYEQQARGGRRKELPGDADIPFASETDATPAAPAAPGGEAARAGAQRPEGAQAGQEPGGRRADVGTPDTLDDTQFSSRSLFQRLGDALGFGAGRQTVEVPTWMDRAFSVHTELRAARADSMSPLFDTLLQKHGLHLADYGRYLERVSRLSPEESAELSAAMRQRQQEIPPTAAPGPPRRGPVTDVEDLSQFSPRRTDTEPAGPTLLETREATREELAARQRVADRQLAEVGMRGRQVSGAPQQTAADLPLFGGERQTSLLQEQPAAPAKPTEPDQGSLFSPRQPVDPIDAAELTERAKALTGLTNNPREAGYITSDGAMLDLSGRHEAQDYVRQGDRFVARRGDYLGDTRNTDHRDIAQQLVESGGSEAMAEFMNRSGAVRVDFNSGIVHATVVPTPRQIQAIVRGARAAGLDALIVEHDGPDLKTISRADVQNITAQNIARVFGETLEGDTLFSPRPIQPTPEEHALSVNDILDPATPSMKPRSRKTQDIARELMVRGQKALIAMGIPTGRITGPNPQTDRMLARVIAAEAIRAFNERGAATDWYTSSFKEALAIAEVIHPELKDDPHQLFAFTATLAITSQGEKVQNNANLTDPIYEHFKETGRFPTDILGSKQKGPMNTNFKKLNGLLDAKGTMDEVIEFMNTEWTVRDLKKMGYKIGGENVDTVVFGSAILGPKIGQGFFQNLSGNYDPVTMDLWFMRAWGRLTGTLVGKQDLTKQTARMTNALEEEGMKVPQDTPGLIEIAEQTVRQHEKDFKTFRSEYDDGTRKKSEVVFASERLLHGLRGINESPKSGADRVWMRDVINQARRIAAYHEVPLTNADLQAVWWYPEKTLYEKLGGIPADEVNVDYAGAQRELARSKGIPDAEVDNVLRSLERRPGRSGGRDDDGRGDSAGVQERDRGDARPYLRDPLRTGISTPEEGTPGVNRLEVSGDSLFSPRTGEAREPAPVFYSALTRGVEGLKQTKAPPGQWANTIKNMPGIKAEEREWVGVEDWLAKQPKSVTKEELLDYIRANEIKVTETIKGDAMTPQQRNRHGELQDFIDQMPEGQVPGRILREFNELDAINRKTGGGQPKYEEWTLGGGKNYRELLLTLPIKREAPLEWEVLNRKLIDKYGGLNEAFDNWTTEEKNEFDRVHGLGPNDLTDPREVQYGDKGAFMGSHWSEPNVLAHIRFDDRWMGNQKVLHVAEIQSDWHQAGKKKGYKTGNEPDPVSAVDRYNASTVGLNDMLDANDRLGFDTLSEARQAIIRDGPGGWEFNTPEDLAHAQEFRDAFLAAQKKSGAVPDAPFKTTWPELAMKRVIRYAAENGYDRVTWDVGKTVADRFDLSQHISDVTLHGTGDNMRLTAHDRNGSAVVDMQHVTTETLPDYIGQDAAERLLALPEPDLAKNPYAVRSLHSEDLKVGGEGMDAFYDKQLPILANKAGKKFGAKTEMDTLGAERTRSWEHFSAWVGEHPEFQGMTRDRQYQAWTRGEKSSLVLEYMRDTTEAPVHSFEITDALRTAAVEEGQTLFSPRNPANMGENPNRPRTAEQKAAFLKARAAPEATGLINAARQMWDNRSTAGKAVVREVFDPYIGVKSAGDDEGYVGLRIANSVAGAIEMFKRWGTLKIDGQAYRMDEKNGGVIDHLIRPLDKLGEATDFIWWVAGERADRLATQDRERLMDAPTIEAFKTLADGQLTGQWKMLDGSTTTDRRTAYGDALARLETFNKNALDLAVKSGLLKRTVARTDFAPGAEGDAQHAAAQGKIDALWENPFYVPFYRAVEDSNSRSFAGAPNKFGMVKQEAFKTLKGGEEKLNNDLWENAFGNWGHMIDASLRNQAATNVLTTAEQNGNVVTRLTRQEYDNVIDKKTKAETVWVMEDGEQVYFHVKDPFIFKAISALEYMQSDLPLMGLGRAAKKVLQIGTAMNPIFQVKNLIRDTINASAVSNINRNVISNWVRGFAAHDMKGDLLNVAYAVAGQERPENISRKMADAIAGGGVVRFAALNDAGVKDTTVANILDSPDKLKTFAGYFSRIGGAYAKLVGMTEGVNRYAFYDQLIKDGVPHDMASFAARDLNDITLKGASPIVRTILELRPFTGAWLQGIYKAGRSAANADESISLAVGGKLGKQAAWRLTQGVIVLATANLALHEIYKDDKDYLARDEYDQNSNFWFKAFGKEWRIPMGFEVGSLARMMAISAMAMYDKDMDFNRWRKNMFSIAQDNMMLGFVPQALSPIFEVARNESRTGSPIESQRLERVRPEARYTSESSMAARSASEGLNRVARFFGGEEASTYSPVQLDYLLRAYTGWLGHTASQIVDVALRGLSDEPTRPAKDWVGALSQNIVSETPSSERGSSRFISQLYNQGDSIKEAYNTYKELKKQGRPAAELESYMERNEPLIEKYRQFTKVIEREGKINEKVRRVENDREMSAAEKQMTIRELNAAKQESAMSVFRPSP